jgi:hypothetical protein
MSQAPVPKKTLAGVMSKFDKVVEKTANSGAMLGEHFKGYVSLNRPDNYSGIRNKIKTINEVMVNIPFIKKFVMKPASQGKWANYASRYFGGTTGLMAAGILVGLFKDPAKYSIQLDSLLNLSTGNVSYPLSFVLWEIGAPAKLVTLAPVFMTGLIIVSGFASFAAFQAHKIRQAGQFFQRKENVMGEMIDLLTREGVGSAPKLDKLVKSFEKSFKPDFSPQQTQAIRDAIAVHRSETGITATFTPSQIESLNKITATLMKQYFVPAHLATNAGLQMIVEMDGNEKAVMAKLKSRNIEEDWVNRFKMEPLATVEGSRKNLQVVDEPLPSP